LILEVVLAIQAGENPRLISDRLMTSVPPAERGERDDEDAGDGPSLAEAA
jgi:flagellar motor component MotA